MSFKIYIYDEELMELAFDLGDSVNVDLITLQKMALVYNAIQEGWTVKKREDRYVFSKPHRQQKEVYMDSFLRSFLETNLPLPDKK